MNAEKVLRTLGIDAIVDAADIDTARASRDAQILLTTPEIVDKLQGLPSEVIAIDHVFDLTELSEKLSKAIL
jgi:PTS system ascorbate-specific IIB component